MNDFENLINELQISNIKFTLQRDPKSKKLEEIIILPALNFYDNIKKNLQYCKYKLQNLVSLYKEYIINFSEEVKEKIIDLIEELFKFETKQRYLLYPRLEFRDVTDEDINTKLQFFNYLDLSDELLFIFAQYNSGVHFEFESEEYFKFLLCYHYMKFCLKEYEIETKELFNEKFLQEYPEFSNLFDSTFRLDKNVRNNCRLLKSKLLNKESREWICKEEKKDTEKVEETTKKRSSLFTRTNIHNNNLLGKFF